MTNKELQEWEEEAKEADQDVKYMSKILVIGGFIVLLAYIIHRYL